MDDGSFLAQGYAPTKHTLKMSVKTERRADHGIPTGAAQRSKPAAFWSRPFDQRDGGAHRVPGRGGSGRWQGQKGRRSSLSRATADVNPPETPLEAIFDDQSSKKRVTGPIGFAIDGKDETAWGIDVGPGRRNQPRKAVFTAEKPISFPGGTLLTFHLVQNHGGWNSDDNQNHNLGRFRLSITTAPDAKADPVPAGVRTILAIPRGKRTAAQTAAVFATGGRQSRNGRRPTPGSNRWQAASRGIVAAGVAGARASAGRPTSCNGVISSNRPHWLSRVFPRF